MKMLIDSGCEVHAAASNAEGRMKEIEDIGIKCWEISFDRSPFSIKNLPAYYELKKVLKNNHYDLIHMHTPVASIVGRCAAAITKQQRPVIIYTAHGFHFFKGGSIKNWLFYPIERTFARLTDVLITINEEDFLLAQQFKTRHNKVFKLNGMGVDLRQFETNDSVLRQKVRRMLNISDQAKVIITVAEVNDNKNQLQVIQSLPYLIQEDPNILYLIVGNGASEDKLKRITQELRLSGCVHFLGFRRDIPKLLLAADVFVLTSKREGLGLAAVEAMAAGLPLVMTNTVGGRTLIRPGINGWLVPRDDPQATATAIREILNNTDGAKQMAKINREVALNYSLAYVKHHLFEVYDEFLGLRGTTKMF